MEYAQALERYFNKFGFYHFTDTRNIPAIVAVEGILSRREAARLKHPIEVLGGNNWSIEADDRVGMDAYVHLCFTKDHPMEFLARQDGRIQDSNFLAVGADVLKIPGTMCTLDVSNKAGVAPISIQEACKSIDFEVLYRRTDWNDSEIQKRLQQVKKYEILVPTKIPIALVSGY
jgi:ssDNA thymidine ADP-ribosyltransferase, DarT